MPWLKIALLGSPEIKLNGTLVKSDRRKAVALLAYLAVTMKPHSRNFLSALLWPDYQTESAFAYLRRTLWELNQILGKGWIVADREQAGLNWERDIRLDILEFRETLHTQQDNTEALAQAVEIYRGDFMAGFAVADTAPFEEWQIQQADNLRRELSHALERIVDLYDRRGEYDAALPFSRRWLGLDQLNESAHRAIMRLHAGMGDRTGAVRQYEACAQILKDELGIDPQRETQELYEAVLRGEVPGDSRPIELAPVEISAEDEGVRPAFHLPAMPTPFIGRRSEVEQVKSLILDTDKRLVSLTGPGGTGKTRLAIQAASELLGSFADGVCFAALASVEAAEDIVPAVAKALDFTFFRDENRRQQLLDFLREKYLLLILDNFEHVLGSSRLLSDIIAYAPGVKLVVTSRIQLNLMGEQLFPVGGMRFPNPAEAAAWEYPADLAAEFSSVQLFVERARRVQPAFDLTKENAAPVIEICRLVQGMPLALELAAAWVELLPPDDIAGEVLRSLDFLETDWADVPDRQHSLRAVFNSSWLLLSGEEQEAFLSLCVFIGSFSREAARSVSQTSLRNLMGLANKSFLQQTDGGRFQLHELMRQYGEERLRADRSAWNQVKNRHADYFASYVHKHAFKMRGPEQLAGLKALIDEFDGNIKDAWYWLVAQGRWQVLIEKMALGIFQYGTIRWQSDELIPWFRAARIASAAENSFEAVLYSAIFGTMEIFCEETAGVHDAGPVERLRSIWQTAVLQDLAEAMGFWFIMLAGLVKARNLVPDVDEMLDVNLSRLREQNTPWLLGIGLLFKSRWISDYVTDEDSLLEAGNIFQDLGVIYEQGLVAENQGNYAYKHRRPLAEVTAHYNRARHFFGQFKGYSPNTGINLGGLADIYFQQGKYEEGFSLFEEEQGEMERSGQRRLLRYSKHWESIFAARYSTYETAQRLRQDCLELTRIYGSQSDLAWQLYELGDVYRIFGDPEKALVYYDQARPMFAKMQMALGLGFDQRGRGDLALADKRYSDALLHYEQFNNYAVDDKHNWAMAQARGRIALAMAYQGHSKRARQDMQIALDQTAEFPYDDLALQNLLAEPVCRLQEGNPGGAVEIVSFILSQAGSWNETKQQARSIQEAASQELKPDAVLAAIERGKALDLETIIAQLPKM